MINTTIVAVEMVKRLAAAQPVAVLARFPSQISTIGCHLLVGVDTISAMRSTEPPTTPDLTPIECDNQQARTSSSEHPANQTTQGALADTEMTTIWATGPCLHFHGQWPYRRAGPTIDY